MCVYTPRCAAFSAAAKDQPRLRLALDADVTLAFAAGSVVNIKTGRQVELEQRSTGGRLWSADAVISDPTWPVLVAETHEIQFDRTELAVAIGLTHDVSADGRKYCEAALPDVGKILVQKPSCVAARNRSRADGTPSSWPTRRPTRYAAPLSAEATSPTSSSRQRTPSPYLLGQRQNALGRVRLCEFDFDGGRGRSYIAALTLPPGKASA
ncbi:SAVED domain-containing protein [Bradyrhizobium japonicum]|uniref:SAVED domain-containing protein n=1 Tax=Bradyrhizobium japonicum TaxID=375 RepID=UPI002010EF13|nr:SAVED domain-containing protein [Bradyrhizobium japonicum]